MVPSRAFSRFAVHLLSPLLVSPLLAAAVVLAVPHRAPAQSAAPASEAASAAHPDAALGLDTAGFDRFVPPEDDPHSPPRYRVNGIVPHLDAFHAAFDVEEGDGLWRPPEERVDIW